MIMKLARLRSAQRWRDSRKQKGLCVSCSSPKAKESKVYCNKHLLINNIKNVKNKLRRLEKELEDVK